MKAVDGEVMKLGASVLDETFTSSSYAQDQSKLPSNGTADSSHPSPGASQEVKVKGGGDTKHPEPGGPQEIRPKFTGKVTLSGKHPID